MPKKKLIKGFNLKTKASEIVTMKFIIAPRTPPSRKIRIKE
jgi:hypothetical protein